MTGVRFFSKQLENFSFIRAPLNHNNNLHVQSSCPSESLWQPRIIVISFTLVNFKCRGQLDCLGLAWSKSLSPIMIEVGRRWCSRNPKYSDTHLTTGKKLQLGMPVRVELPLPQAGPVYSWTRSLRQSDWHDCLLPWGLPPTLERVRCHTLEVSKYRAHAAINSLKVMKVWVVGHSATHSDGRSDTTVTRDVPLFVSVYIRLNFIKLNVSAVSLFPDMYTCV